MRNPLIVKGPRRNNGTIAPIAIEVINEVDALQLLARVKRQGIYRPYLPQVMEALKKLKPNEHIRFHVPQLKARTVQENCKRLMSVINVALKASKINQRLRHPQDTDLLVSEPVDW